jgi:hypothetical protein
MSVGVMKDEKVKLRELHVSYTLCYSDTVHKCTCTARTDVQ